MAMQKAKKTETAKKAATATNTPLIYVSRDIERALGCEPAGSYYILANKTPYAESVREKFPDNVFLIDEKAKTASSSGELLDTVDLLKSGEKIIEKISDKSGAEIVVFKNTMRIEECCSAKKWKLLNPPAALAEEIENKITQVKWLGSGKNGAEKYLPPHAVTKVSEIKLKNNKASDGSDLSAPFMVQWAHSHTGDGTIFIGADKAGEKTLAALREKFPDRDTRVTAYVTGPVFTVNICVPAGKKSAAKETDSKILIGNISSQITGMLPFTDNPWSTVGNDWSLTHSILDEEKIKQFHEIGNAVGERMRASGWVGLFGIDCIYDIERNNLHLIEVNARQPASTTFESKLQAKIRELAPDHFKNSQTIFEAHIAAVRGENAAEKTAKSNGLIEINDGSQIILRIPAIKEMQKNSGEIAEISASLRAKDYTVIEYANVKPGTDLLRIQSDRGIMESQHKFNKRGKEVLETVTGVSEETDDGSSSPLE